MKETLYDTIGKAVDRIKKSEGVLAIYIFGSFARKEAGFRSDIDLCIIPENKEKWDIAAETELAGELPSFIDLVNFYRLPVQTRYRVIKEGRLMYEKDRERVSRIIFSTLKEYLDRRPALERLYKSVLEAGT